MTDEIERYVQDEDQEEKKLNKLKINEEKDEKKLSVLNVEQDKIEKKFNVLKDEQEKFEKKFDILKDNQEKIENKFDKSKDDQEKVENKLNKLDDDDEYDFITVPPDGGFGWIVVFVCFIINMIVDGFFFAYGGTSKDIQDYFKCQEWAIALVISLACGFYMLSAPLASALCNKWGCRRVGVIGSVIAAFSIAASIFSPNVMMMWLLFGLIGGIGMGLIYLPSIVIVGYYFEEKRAIATGIVTAGTGIGSIIFAPFQRLLFNLFGWKTAIFLEAIIILCCAICCAFMRPLTPVRKRRILPPPEQMEETVQKIMTPASSIKGGKATPATSIRGGKLTPATSIRGAKITPTIVIIPSPHDEDPSLTELSLEDDIKKRCRTESGVSNRSRQSIRAEDAVRPLYKEDVLYQGDTRDLPEFQSQPDIPTYIQQTTKVPEAVEQTKMKAFWDTLLTMTNFHLLRDKKIIIICVANVFSMFGYFTPYIFLPNYATLERGIPADKAVFLISLIGFSNTISRFASGWVTKIPSMSPLLVNNIGLMVAGALTLFVPLCQTYFHYSVYCLVWGGFVAFHLSLSPVIVCQIVGLELYSSALGLIFLFRGAVTLAGPPILGAIRDVTASFAMAFILSGFTLIISSLMHFSLMWIDRSNKVEIAETNKVKEFQENPVETGV